jgi:citrate lyase subunit beta/citryl-CoA lyase
MRLRSLLFVPAHRPDMVAKLPRWQPDAAVVDLEDAVPAEAKEAARAMAVEAIQTLDLDGTVMFMRVNPVGTEWFAGDVAAAARSAATGVVLPKYDDTAQLAELRTRLAAAGRPEMAVLVGLETVRAVADARVLLAAGVEAAYFGAEDYIADLGGRRTDDGDEVLYARSGVAVMARLAGVPVIDQAVVAIGDDARFAADAGVGRDLGYTGKICVHPAQVALSHAAFSPTAAEVAHARRVLEAAAGGVASLDGQMVDEVHVRMARAVIALAP